MLQFGKDDARRLIQGNAYQYKGDLQGSTVTLSLKKFANEHGTPAQRFYNVLCIAYGADKALFADVVAKGYLPANRAEGCEGEIPPSSVRDAETDLALHRSQACKQDP